MNKVIGVVVALAVVLGGGYVLTSNGKKSDKKYAGTVPQVETQVEIETESIEIEVSEGEVVTPEVLEEERSESPIVELNVELDPEVPQKVTLSTQTPEPVQESEPAPTPEPIAVGNTRTAGSGSEQPGIFTRYSRSKLDDATGNIVLSFTADWCPSCRALESDLETNASSIPSDLTILDVDYDTATDLKKKYGVTLQHTLVQVDSEGNKIQSWRGGNTLDSIVERIN